MMKKAFTLFSTLVLVFIFSVIIVNIFEVKSLSSVNIQKQYKYIQAKNHLVFLEEYVKSLADLEKLNKIQIKDEKYIIFALIKKVNTKYEIELIVEALDFNIRVYKRIEVIK